MAFQTKPHALTRKLGAIDSQIHGDTAEPVPKDSPWLWLIVGGRGSGKTSLFLNVLRHHLRGHYDAIHLVSKTYKSDMESKRELRQLVEELEGDGRVYTTLTEDLAEELIEDIEAFNERWKAEKKKKKNKRPPRHLVVLDDQLAQLPRGRLRSRINDLVANGRHLKTSLVVLTQKYTSVPTLWRANAQLVSLFHSANRREVEAAVGDFNADPADFLAKYEFATAEPKSFLHLNTFAERPIYYKRFDKITSPVGSCP
jgi:hypothetical protein